MKHPRCICGHSYRSHDDLGHCVVATCTCEHAESTEDVDRFWWWLILNRNRLRSAAAELGIRVDEGPRFTERLRAEFIRATVR